MALIGKIREKSAVAIGVIMIAMILFIVGSDLFGPGSTLFSGDTQTVGEIAGQKVSIQEFSQRLEEFENRYKQQTQGRSPSDEERNQIREQVWNQYIQEIAYQKQYDKLGLAVSGDELFDMVQGANIHPFVEQSFTDPSTNQFNKEMVTRYLGMLKADTLGPQATQQWADFERGLAEARLREKYENLLKMSTYVTKAEAQREYESQTAKADVKFVYVPFAAIPDSTIQVTDEQLQAYLDRNRAQYQGEQTRSIEYVTFPVIPSKEDSTALYDEIKDLAKGLASAQDDSTFAANNSDVPSNNGYVTLSEVPQQLQGQIATFIEGGMYGPYREGDTYSIYKLADIKEDTVYSVRASHILFRADSTAAGKAEARKKALDVLQQIKKGADFEQMARQYGADGTAQQGGDLGWYTQGGGFVKPFEDALLKFNGTGLLPNLVETQFGYHIVKITQPKTNKKYKVLAIKKNIVPGEATREEAFKQADYFAGTVNNTEEFRAAVEKDKALMTSTAEKVEPNASNINTLTNAREVVQWAFKDETEVGSVSPTFELDNQYVVATVTGKSDEGEATVDDFRPELTSKVRNELKAEQIKKKLQAAKGNLDAIAKTYGEQAQVQTAQDVTLNASTLQSVGFDPVAVGKIFGLKQGQRTQPFAGENGVLVVEMANYTPAPQIADYSQYKNQAAQTASSRTEFSVNEAIKENADIEDNRYKFY